jgi:hypothetical protein
VSGTNYAAAQVVGVAAASLGAGLSASETRRALIEESTPLQIKDMEYSMGARNRIVYLNSHGLFPDLYSEIGSRISSNASQLTEEEFVPQWLNIPRTPCNLGKKCQYVRYRKLIFYISYIN